jgi:thioredoxin reductase (NADPH)
LRRGAIKPFQMAVGGVLVRVGVEPNAELFRGQVVQDTRGYIRVTSEQETSVENVFAVGDISNPRAPTISSATGAGATAAKVLAARLGHKSH